MRRYADVPGSPMISAVVCTYTLKRWDLLVAAISSLRRQRRSLAEIIVVVDHNEALLARLRYEMPWLKSIPNDREPGLSGARNAGVAAARGEIVAWLDDDAEASAGWSARVMEDFADPEVVGVGSAIVPRWEDCRPRWFPVEFNWVVGCTYRGVPTDKSQIRNPLGAAMALRRDAVVAAGGFRADIGRFGDKPLGCEETELCVRIRQMYPELKIIQDPFARVSHFVPQERMRWRYFRSRCFAEGQSKAWISATVGSADALSTERAYVLKVLPAGIGRNLFRELWADWYAVARAGAIAAGALITASGFVAGMVRKPQVWALEQERSGVPQADRIDTHMVSMAGRSDASVRIRSSSSRTQ